MSIHALSTLVYIAKGPIHEMHSVLNLQPTLLSSTQLEKNDH